MAAVTDSSTNNIAENPAFLAALNNNNNVIDMNDPNNFVDSGNQPGFSQGLTKLCSSFCSCKGLVRSFTFYYLTLNILVLILTVIYNDSGSSTAWWVAFLIAVIVNIILCIATLVMLCFTERTAPDGDLAGQNPVSTPEEDKSGSFKTVLTINSKTMQPTVSVIKSPAIEVESVPGSKQAATATDGGFVNLTPGASDSKTPDEGKKRDKGKHKGGRKDGKHKKDKDKIKNKDKDKAPPARETNFAAIPSNVLAKEVKREDNVKKKKKTKPDKKKK